MSLLNALPPDRWDNFTNYASFIGEKTSKNVETIGQFHFSISSYLSPSQRTIDALIQTHSIPSPISFKAAGSFQGKLKILPRSPFLLDSLFEFLYNNL